MWSWQEKYIKCTATSLLFTFKPHLLFHILFRLQGYVNPERMISPPGRLIPFPLACCLWIFKIFPMNLRKTKQTQHHFPLGCSKCLFLQSTEGIQVAQEVLSERVYSSQIGAKEGYDAISRNLFTQIEEEWRITNFLNNSTDPHQTAWCLKLSAMKGVLQRGSNKRLMRIWVFNCFWRQEIKNNSLQYFYK